MEIVQNEGDRTISRKMNFYNLDAIIALATGLTRKKQLISDMGN
jgi:hypothetical protein